MLHSIVGIRFEHTYDAAGSRTAQHLVVGSVLRSSYFQYDRDNRTMRSIAADGGSTYFGYDLAGNQTLVTDPVGRPTYTAYDQLNRTYCRYDAQLNKTYWSYDARGSAVREIDPEGRAVYMGYDPARRLFHQSNALGEFSYFFYDARGARTHVLNPRGYSTYFRFDLLGRNTHREHALGGVAYMGYDEVGNQVLVSDELGNSTYLTYDGLRRLTHSKDQAAGVTYMAFDNRSSMTLRCDADGRATYMAYDSARRLERQWHKTGVAGETDTAPSYYVYNALGNVTLVDDRVGGLGVSYFDYDKLSRVTKKTTIAGAVYSAYDLSGMKTFLMDPALGKTYFVFDSAGRNTAVEAFAGRTAYYVYDKSGLPTRKIGPANENLAYLSYDGKTGRLSELVNRSSAGAVVTYFLYQRNANGAPTRITHEDGTFTYFTYDALDRIGVERRKGASTIYGFSYSYDLASRRQFQTNDATGDLTSWGHDSRNLVTSEFAYPLPSFGYEWDAAQRLKGRYGDTEAAYFTHDQRNQLRQIHFVGSGTTHYFHYNGVGERVAMVGGQGGMLPTYLSYNAPKILTERDETGFAYATYRYAPTGEPVDVNDAEVGAASAPVGDANASVNRLVGVSGGRIYDTFGVEFSNSISSFARTAFVSPLFQRLRGTPFQISMTPGGVYLANFALLDWRSSQHAQLAMMMGAGIPRLSRIFFDLGPIPTPPPPWPADPRDFPPVEQFGEPPEPDCEAGEPSVFADRTPIRLLDHRTLDQGFSSCIDQLWPKIRNPDAQELDAWVRALTGSGTREVHPIPEYTGSYRSKVRWPYDDWGSGVPNDSQRLGYLFFVELPVRNPELCTYTRTETAAHVRTGGLTRSRELPIFQFTRGDAQLGLMFSGGLYGVGRQALRQFDAHGRPTVSSQASVMGVPSPHVLLSRRGWQNGLSRFTHAFIYCDFPSRTELYPPRTQGREQYELEGMFRPYVSKWEVTLHQRHVIYGKTGAPKSQAQAKLDLLFVYGESTGAGAITRPWIDTQVY